MDTLEKEVVEAFRSLPPEKQKEALDFLEFLKNRFSPSRRSRLKGLWKQFQVEIGEQDIRECRRQMWSSFPREIEK
jgi:hypothetical protein